MDKNFYLIWFSVLVPIGVLQLMLDHVAKNPRYAHLRIRPFAKNRYSDAKRITNTSLNAVFSLLCYVFFFEYFGAQVFNRTVWPGGTTFLGEVLGVLMLYDFAYYFYHRIAHHPTLMRYMHGVHHFVRNPTASESTYLNPLEPLGSFVLYFGAIYLIGPISTTSFFVIFFIHSAVNLVVHSSLQLPHPAFRLFNFWVQKHDAHHQLFKVNYASIFPFWDQLFGTSK